MSYLTPDDAERIEADAQQLFEEVCEAEGLAISWAAAPDFVRRLYLDYAANPYAFLQRPAPK